MRKKTQRYHNQFFQTALPAGCWTPNTAKRQHLLQRLCKKYHKNIDTLLATIAIGLMFLTGIWMFLTQLAEYGL